MKLIIDSCRQCPFFRETPGLGSLLKFLAPDLKSGWCAFNRLTGDVTVIQLGLPPGTKRDDIMRRLNERLIIEDRDQVPAQCPLRAPEGITVTLGS